jgi:hypothetical protein
LAELARLDGLIGGSGNKPAATMSNAVAQTEKIRDWVSSATAKASCLIIIVRGSKITSKKFK